MSKKSTTYLLVVLMLLSGLSSSAQTNTALSFNIGTADYVTTDVGANPITFAPLTVELWVYVPFSQPGLHSFISQGPSTNQFSIGYDGDNSNHIYLGDQWVDANVPLPMGQWNHIALTWNGNDSAWLFLNGVQVDSLVDGSYFVLPGTQLQLGTDVDNSTYFTGTIDQVRIWDHPRSATEIKQGMYGAVDSTSTGLLIDYLFDGNPGVIHNSGSIGNVDLTIMNSTATVASPIQSSENSLSFRASANTKAVAHGSSALDLTTGTIEAWINPNTVNGTILTLGDTSAVPTSTRFSIHLDNTSIPALHTIGISSSAAALTKLVYPAGFTAGHWYHLALVTAYNPGLPGDTTGVFINGVYAGRINKGYDNLAASSLPLILGANGVDNSENWDGNLDDVSIWNIPLAQSDIVSHLTTSPTGNEPGLVAYYNFNQGITDGTNTGITLAVDYAPPTNNATMSNFSLASLSTTNFTGRPLDPLPLTLLQFTVTKQSNTGLLQWQTGQEQNTREFIIERSGNGKDFTDIGSVAAAGTSHTKRYYTFTDNTPLEGKNYYRLRETDLDSKSTYSDIRILAFTMAGNLIWYSTGTNAAEVRLHNGSNELYTITDMAGHTLRTGRLSSGVAPVSQMPSGVYFVKVVTNAGNELTAKVLLK